ncbi:hypothetical protein ACJIZ3_002869 [Penstemon smallii]|uniref:Cystatin domain-containing protein n=1 Tax=Penstemon smallii TaxID=265156 RepID=A0ABD3U7P9_9LAMI
MAFKSLVIFALLSVLATAAFGISIVGHWRPIENPNDPGVVEIAKFAVAEHNKEAHAALGFVSVVKGETQVVAGTKYRLVISAKDGSATKNYDALVWDKPWEKFRKLVFFKESIAFNN